MDIESMDQSMIMKGKRTKRPRQPSPASAVITASSCSSGGDGDGGGCCCGGGGGGGQKMCTNKIRSSESLCSEILSTSTEEDEDMANCLILLAQSPTIQIIHNIEKREGGEIKLEKTSTRKSRQITTTTPTTTTTSRIGGKGGIYVYECKTCNRSFPSFQALGGHRTSHKKQKPTVEMKGKKIKNLPPSLDDHYYHQENKQYEEEEKGVKFLEINLEIVNKNAQNSSNVVINNNNIISKGKIHECSICSAEFSSGQALGGHMRRHRNPTSATILATGSSRDDGGERPRNILEFDLNLPAPPEDEDLIDSQFQFSLFSSPALVDCQY